VIATSHLRGIGPAAIQEGLASFQGIKRRMEVRGVEREVTVIDDFAHHPTAIETTLRGAKLRYPGRRIWALFEPRSISSGRREFQQGYIDAFHAADRVIIGPIYHKERYVSRYGLDKMLSTDEIAAALAENGIESEYIEDFDEIARRVAAGAEEGDVVIVMSSGAFGGVHERILAELGR
jgi:UDP-N-acetylmuramate: L-alanyl-gamma-D-glutamyl-meso-diaminopimelate ligase